MLEETKEKFSRLNMCVIISILNLYNYTVRVQVHTHLVCRLNALKFTATSDMLEDTKDKMCVIITIVKLGAR